MNKLPKQWTTYNLGDLITIKHGYAFKGEYFSDIEGPIVITPGNYTEDGLLYFRENKIKRYTGDFPVEFIFSNGDLTVVMTDLSSQCKILGKPAFIQSNETLLHNQRIGKIIFKDDLLYDRFLYFFLLTNPYAQQIKNTATGSTVRHTSPKKIYNAPINIPKVNEQKRIVSKLNALFERIDQSIALLEENIKHTEALMASALDEVFGEGSIPIKDVCEINPKKSEVRNLVDASIEVSFLPMAELNEFRSDFNASQTKEISEVYKGYTYFKESDVLLAKVTPCFENGKAGISRNLTNGIGFGSSEFHVIRPNEKILPEWIYYSVLTQKFRDAGVLAFTGSSGLKRVPAKFVENWKISLPPINEQKQIISRINEAISKLTKVKSTYMGTLDYYKSLKESILDKAFKGEL